LFSLLAPSPESLILFGASGAIPVFGLGHWWTVVSATWLHGGLLHILFNMMWVRQLGPVTAEAYGAARMVIIYTIAGVTGFVASTLSGSSLSFLPTFIRGAGFTVGASAPIFGLLGALVYYGRRGSSVVGSQALTYVIFLGIFGFVMPGVDNYAHAGGFGGGYLAAQLLDPLKPERIDHIAVALVCLLASVIAIIVSVLHGLQFLG